jgi:hypothetical protein
MPALLSTLMHRLADIKDKIEHNDSYRRMGKFQPLPSKHRLAIMGNELIYQINVKRDAKGEPHLRYLPVPQPHSGGTRRRRRHRKTRRHH